MNHALLRTTASLFLLGSLVVLLQTGNYTLTGLWAVCAGLLLLFKPMRSMIATTIWFGIGFFAYLYVNTRWIIDLHPKELHIFVHRLSLIFILIPFVLSTLINKVPFMRYGNKPQWNEPVGVPLIWTGYTRTKVADFLTIAMVINVLAFMPLMFRSGWTYIQEVWVLAVIFAVTNAVLEELVWRGVLLSRLSEPLGEKGAVLVTSIGFGLQHYSLGFSWGTCIAFSVGGFYFGGITVQSRSIVPSVIWHMSINAFMVFSAMV